MPTNTENVPVNTQGMTTPSLSTVITPTTTSAVGSNTITSASLAPVSPLPVYTPPPDLTNYNALLAGSVPTSYTQKASSIIDETDQLLRQLEGKSSYEQQQLEQSGATTLEKRQNALTAQLNALNTSAQAIPLQIQKQFEGTGATVGGAQPFQTAALRNNAIQALSLKAEYDLNSGDLITAKENAQRAVDLKYKSIETAIDTNTKLLQLYYPFMTTEQKTIADQRQSFNERIKQDIADKKKQQTDVINAAQTNGDSASASAALQLDPNSSTFTQDLATIQARMTAKPETVQVTETDASGNVTVATIDKNTGKVVGTTNLGKVGKGATSQRTENSPLSILDVQRYNELYPEAGVVAGDTATQANAKITATNTPEAKLRNQIIGYQTSGKSYEEIVTNINESKTLKDKSVAIKIADEVFGRTPSISIPPKPVYGTGNFAKTDINDRKSQLEKIGFSASQVKAQLKQNGYPIKEVNKVSGNVIDKLTGFLFGE